MVLPVLLLGGACGPKSLTTLKVGTAGFRVPPLRQGPGLQLMAKALVSRLLSMTTLILRALWLRLRPPIIVQDRCH